MKTYQYQLQYRPFGFGCQPKGQIAFEEKNERYNFGILTYDRELTEHEVEAFELKKVEE